MFKEFLLTLGLGATSYYIGQKVGEKLSLEKAKEIVDKNKQTYANLTTPKIWLQNTIAAGIFNTPILGPTGGTISLYEKGKIAGAYKAIGEPYPRLPVSPWIETPTLALSGAQGIKNTYNLLTRNPIQVTETMKILGISSAILIPSAIIEDSELKER